MAASPYLSRARGRGFGWIGNGSRCILVRDTEYGDVLVGSRVMVLKTNAPVQGDFAGLGRV